MPPVSPETLLLLFMNFSAFHGDGEVVWLGEQGSVVVQLAGRASRPKEHCIFEYRLAPARLAEVRKTLAGLKITQEQIADRPGIPDEVRVTFAYRGKDGSWTQISTWEHDQGNQGALLDPLQTVVRELIADCEKQKPKSCEPLVRGEVRLYTPAHLKPEPPAGK